MTPHPHPHPGAVLHTFAFASLTISSETTGFRVFFVPDWKKKKKIDISK